MGAFVYSDNDCFKIAFPAPPPDLILIKDIIYTKGNYYKRKLKRQGISQAL